MKTLVKTCVAVSLLCGVLAISPAEAATCPPTWVEVGDAPGTFPGQITNCVIPSDNVGANITGTLSPQDVVDIFQVYLSERSVAQGFIFGSSSLVRNSNSRIVFTAYDFNQVVVGAPIVLNSPFPKSEFAFTEFSLSPDIYYLKVHGENIRTPVSYQFQASFVPPTSDVPGPLGIFGVGAAFAYSRKLRNRIKNG